MKRIYDHPILAFLISLFILLVVVYVLVDHKVSLRVLAEPVAQTRHGITIKIEDALLFSDKTQVFLSVKNISFKDYSHRKDLIGCISDAKIRLPSRTLLQQENFPYNTPGDSRIGIMIVFGAIPYKANNVTLTISCLMFTFPGLAPENWELPMHFIPAPPVR
jgi:hypothetical protein